MDDDIILCKFILNKCAERPDLCRKVIDAATEGVKQFADNQRNFGARLGFAMTEIIDNTNQGKFGNFSRKDLIEMTKPWLEGTQWWKDKNKNI